VDAEMPVDRPDIMPSNATNVAHMLATLKLNQALGKIAHEMYVVCSILNNGFKLTMYQLGASNLTKARNE
jgi:hypothetical protein